MESDLCGFSGTRRMTAERSWQRNRRRLTYTFGTSNADGLPAKAFSPGRGVPGPALEPVLLRNLFDQSPSSRLRNIKDVDRVCMQGFEYYGVGNELGQDEHAGTGSGGTTPWNP